MKRQIEWNHVRAASGGSRSLPMEMRVDLACRDVATRGVVIDWNWIQSAKKSDLVLPPGVIGVVSEPLLQECALKHEDNAQQSDHADRLARKLFEFLRAHSSRVVLGAFWHDVDRVESPCRVARPDAICHRGYTKLLSQTGGLEPDQFIKRIREVCPDLEGARQSAEGFDALCAEAESVIACDKTLKCRFDSVLGQPDGIAALVRQREIVSLFARRASAKVRRSREWQRALCVFPDRHAIGRWTRIVLWYVTKRIRGDSDKGKNNPFDAQYAFLSTYTKKIVTGDKDLQKCVRDIVPDAVIYDQSFKRI